MRQHHILSLACLCLVTAATGASAAMLSPPLPAMTTAIESVAQRQMEVAINDTHLRAKPTTHSDRLATLKRGTKVDVIEMVEHGKWAHVKVLGKMGYISANLLR
jgi:uncharacterized protein YgiM (DUF1202 family)